MLPHLVGSVEPMYHRCDQDGLKDKYQKLISGIFSSYRVQYVQIKSVTSCIYTYKSSPQNQPYSYEDIEYLENNNSPVPAQLKPLENVSQTGKRNLIETSHQISITGSVFVAFRFPTSAKFDSTYGAQLEMGSCL